MRQEANAADGALGNMANFALHNDKSGGLRFGLSATCQCGTYYRLL